MPLLTLLVSCKYLANCKDIRPIIDLNLLIKIFVGTNYFENITIILFKNSNYSTLQIIKFVPVECDPEIETLVLGELMKNL